MSVNSTMSSKLVSQTSKMMIMLVCVAHQGWKQTQHKRRIWFCKTDNKIQDLSNAPELSIWTIHNSVQDELG